MILIVDGYNVLKQQEYGTFIEEKTRSALINKLQRYARKKSLEIVLVFDGGALSWPEKENHGSVQVVYAGVGKSADEYIAHYASEHAQKDLMLISSDRGLARQVEHFHVPTLDVFDFIGLVEQANHAQHVLRNQSELIKTAAGTDEALDELMRQSSMRVPFKEEDADMAVPVRRRNHRPSHAESKRNRLLRKKLAKL